MHGAGVVQGDKVKRAPLQPDAGTAVNHLRIWLPMAKAAKMAPNIWDLLLNILIADSFREGDVVKVPCGTKVHPVPVDRYTRHREILEDSGLDGRARVQAAKHQLLKEERRMEQRMEHTHAAGTSAGPSKCHAAAQNLLEEVVEVMSQFCLVEDDEGTHL